MGNSVACFHPKAANHISLKCAWPRHIATEECTSPDKQSEFVVDDALIRQQALEAVLLFRRHQSQRKPTYLPISRSASVSESVSATTKKKQLNFPRSESTRPSSLTYNTNLQPNQILGQNKSLNILETKHFVLVHGGGFGAWCWYKTIALLKHSGFEVDAVDLTGSGIDSFDSNNVTSLAQYVKPLTDFLAKLGDGEKVVLVGHDFGGSCISYAMELFPWKVAKSIFIAAVMQSGGQSTLDVFSQQTENGMLQRGKILVYSDGNEQPPTAIDFDKPSLQDYFFNHSPDKDIALASVSMRPIPFAPIIDKLPLSNANYGSVRRFYIKTQDDSAMPARMQEAMISAVPPEQVFQLKGSDHCPFFSKPQALHKLLMEISAIP